ncbi:hypothetical protein SAMN03080598_00328 [Algoriphagus boritolerans DSM 17298 = JCM 18970]|uniref:Uncharacterized protein n=1 Tax=Algoriphagus boritolerans DSM 17298 = JCM 18970 TaxID=1120964 RepID=A0A1H5SAA0_9BACT|nr:hypothetical protein SAMN03080598_00328 [Algoriphagus boritolerans DSM 17298 = JCM 18970]
MASNSLVISIAVILILHFLLGIGWLLYKIFGPKPPENPQV